MQPTSIVLGYENTGYKNISVIGTIVLVAEFIPIVLHYQDIGYKNIFRGTFLSLRITKYR